MWVERTAANLARRGGLIHRPACVCALDERERARLRDRDDDGRVFLPKGEARFTLLEFFGQAASDLFSMIVSGADRLTTHR